MEIRPIKNHDGYFISETGIVLKALKPYLNNGYHYVKPNGKHEAVHRLVAHAFHEKEEHHADVNHIDYDRTNNHKDNLEWVTRKENINHGAFQEGWTPVRHFKRCELYQKGELIGEFESTKKALEHAKGMGAKIHALQKNKQQGDFESRQEGVTTIRKE